MNRLRERIIVQACTQFCTTHIYTNVLQGDVEGLYSPGSRYFLP
jgi:hypothetical protein